jgi:hypothetical protein
VCICVASGLDSESLAEVYTFLRLLLLCFLWPRYEDPFPDAAPPPPPPGAYADKAAPPDPHRWAALGAVERRASGGAAAATTALVAMAGKAWGGKNRQAQAQQLALLAPVGIELLQVCG